MSALLHQPLREQILGAAASRSALRIRGGGSKDWYGQRLEGDILDTRACSGIVDYEPTELVITARCGTPLADIEAALAERGQMLAFEPPHFGPAATFGGALASGLSGPRRASAGAARDFVLGTVLMDGRGEVLTFGGQVMKNVAGYDVSRLLAGSLGTLGLLLQASVKVLPRAVRESTRRFAMSEIDALDRLNTWGGQPLPLSASCWHDGVLTVRLSGAGAAVDAAERLLGGDAVPDADAFWRALREQQHPFFADAESLWRLSVPSATGAIILRGTQLIEWGGAQRWLKSGSDSETTNNIRRAVRAVGGHATLFRGGDKAVGVFHPLAPAVAKIHERLKAAFDPAGVFNPGRMY
ncbi:MAG TPA: glycolate oxidase subunit GlcE [Telluria sp.]|jgi:glycolate oxidase FAD binding subunit